MDEIGREQTQSSHLSDLGLMHDRVVALVEMNQRLADERDKLRALLIEARAVLYYFHEDSDEKYATEEGARWIMRYDAICAELDELR